MIAVTYAVDNRHSLFGSGSYAGIRVSRFRATAIGRVAGGIDEYALGLAAGAGFRWLRCLEKVATL
jgi:hypothetical protein